MFYVTCGPQQLSEAYIARPFLTIIWAILYLAFLWKIKFVSISKQSWALKKRSSVFFSYVLGF